MHMNLQVRYSTDKDSWLCFKHAVQAAMNGEDVKTEIDDFSGGYMGRTWCQQCTDECNHSLFGEMDIEDGQR